MSLRVAHVVQSVVAEPGTVSVVLPGLIARLNELDVSSHLTEGIAEADVVHVHGWGYPAAMAAAKAAKRSGTPFIVSTLGTIWEPSKRRSLMSRLRFAWTERPLLRAARFVATVNALEMRALLFAKLNWQAVPFGYGIDTANYAQCRQDNTRRIVFLGSVHPQGGLGELLRVIAEIGPLAEGWTVDVACRTEGDWRAQLEAAILRKGAEHRVRFVEAHDEPAQAALLDGASLVVIPSGRFDAGIPILQASAAGVPMLATRFAGMEILKDAVSLCDPTREALREALRAMLEMSDEQRTVMGEKAREACAAKCDWSVVAPKFAEMYRKVAEARR